MDVRFIFLGEGPFDATLVPHLERLCVEAGATQALGLAPDLGRLPTPPSRTVNGKIECALALDPDVDLVFVHRDADSPDSEPVRTHILDAAMPYQDNAEIIPVVPIQETEAWLLLDEQAIRAVAGNPRGANPLNLPAVGSVESTANPKEALEAALLAAAGLTGRRHRRFRARLGEVKRDLMGRLAVGGEIENVPSWHQLRIDVETAISRIVGRNPGREG